MPSDDCRVDLGGAIAESTTRTPTEHLIRKGISKLRIVNETKLLRLVSELVDDAVHTRLSTARQDTSPTPGSALPSGIVSDDPPGAETPDVYILDDGLEWTTKDGLEWTTIPGQKSTRNEMPPVASRPDKRAPELRQITQQRHQEALARIESCFSALEESIERMERFLRCRTHANRS